MAVTSKPVSAGGGRKRTEVNPVTVRQMSKAERFQRTARKRAEDRRRKQAAANDPQGYVESWLQTESQVVAYQRDPITGADCYAVRCGDEWKIKRRYR